MPDRTPTPHAAAPVDLSVQVDGLRLPNPFVIASGPPGTNANVIAKAFDEGWGGVVCKTVCLDHTRIVNVSPRYARLRVGGDGRVEAGAMQRDGEIVGWENIELISDRPFAQWLADFKRLKDTYPDRVLIATIMEEYNRDAWAEIVGRVQETGVDALEINFSCPHGLPERRMGSAMGQDPELLAEVCGWINDLARIPVWAKLTPNITDITAAGRACLGAGLEGVCGINTILSVMSVNLDTLRPEPTVEGYSTPGGYSGRAVRPIALRMVMELSRMIEEDFSDRAPRRARRSLHAIGGVENGDDAAQYLLVGADTVQVCTGVMIHGYRLIHRLKDQLAAFMHRHNFTSIDQFRGRALPYFVPHSELVTRQRAARAAERASANAVQRDTDWDGDRFVAQSQTL